MSDSVWHDLVSVLGEHRGGHHPRRIARHVCRHADGVIQLIGLTREARRAVYVDPTVRRAYALPISAGGVHPAGISPRPAALAWKYPHAGPSGPTIDGDTPDFTTLRMLR